MNREDQNQLDSQLYRWLGCKWEDNPALDGAALLEQQFRNQTFLQHGRQVLGLPVHEILEDLKEAF